MVPKYIVELAFQKVWLIFMGEHFVKINFDLKKIIEWIHNKRPM